MKRKVTLTIIVTFCGLCLPSCSKRPEQSPLIWNEVSSGTLTLTIKGGSQASLDPTKFPVRDYDKKVNENLEAARKELNAGNPALAYRNRAHVEYDDFKMEPNRNIRFTLYLYREAEDSWPTGTEPLNMQIWGKRTDGRSYRPADLRGPIVGYDIILAGTPGPEGIIKGTATGRLSAYEESRFDGAEFELKPNIPKKQ